ncbi:MAG: peptide ABC transporter substrate-binding protein [marine bacterium B5-7]|nr:MAG: peptide ABC transporter substrate-binding protein [marine bacterium B5-7]
MSNRIYNKAALTVPQQITLLSDRGLTLTPDSTESRLNLVSLHRLKDYCLPFELNKKTHQFKVGTTFEDIWFLYIFDRELRLLVLDIIERIEVALRTTMGNYLSVKYTPHWSLDDNLFKHTWTKEKDPRKNSQKTIFLSEVKSICRNKHFHSSIEKFYEKYTSNTYLPSWIVLEHLSFGKCTSLFRNLRSNKNKFSISQRFGFHYSILESSLESIRYTRNLCAHHSRLWDRWFVYKPKKLKELQAKHCIPGTLKEQLTLLDLLTKNIVPSSSWKNRLFELFSKYELSILFERMGFIHAWKKDLFW